MGTARPNGFMHPCIPTRAAKPPAGPGWVHEIKHDGYRLIVRRDGDTVRLFTRRGYDWSDRYPAIARAAAKLRAMSFTIDGEAAVCGPDGVASMRCIVGAPSPGPRPPDDTASVPPAPRTSSGQKVYGRNREAYRRHSDSSPS
jgi:hypothetical protein